MNMMNNFVSHFMAVRMMSGPVRPMRTRRQVKSFITLSWIFVWSWIVGLAAVVIAIIISSIR